MTCNVHWRGGATNESARSLFAYVCVFVGLEAFANPCSLQKRNLEVVALRLPSIRNRYPLTIPLKAISNAKVLYESFLQSAEGPVKQTTRTYTQLADIFIHATDWM
jgi:hypothetical protein